MLASSEYITIYSHLGRGNLKWENASLSLGSKQGYKDIFLIGDWWEETLLIVYGTSTGPVVLDSKRKQDEVAMESKPVSSTSSLSRYQLQPLGFCPAWVLALTFIDVELWCGSISGINPFLLRELLRQTVFFHPQLARNYTESQSSAFLSHKEKTDRQQKQTKKQTPML